ncbi:MULTISPECIES: helix-turn-helix domain-containing protein [Mycobacterium]|uniref:helix-turn-helix domain-containing protein n=1 Tax=Mycobacterium TaxID=1763 RepID=UPI0022315DAC|nr:MULTISPECIES: helix-turn-helix domain-containing protein [Mycobacterium]
MARTGPRAQALLEASCRSIAAAIVLELGEAPYAGVPCWSGRAQRWAAVTVPVAYHARYDTDVRPAMPGNPVSLNAVRAVAAARAVYADYATGRNCRPTNERLAADTGYSVRTVQRADTALRLLGVATEVLRGRQRTRAERFASWRVGDRRRGWASVWALHDNPLLPKGIGALSPHPRSGPFKEKTPSSSVVTTGTGRPAGVRQDGAARRQAPDQGALALARAWRADAHAPPWAHRHSAQAWAPVLAAPAAHGWTPRDLNQLITDWIGVGHWIAARPHKPIGLLGAVLAWHGTDNLDERPAAADMAREAQQLAADRARIIAQHTARAEHATARAAARAALGGPGHTAARAAAAAAARGAAQRRGHTAAADAADLAARVAAARA